MATNSKGNSITKTVSMEPELGNQAVARANKLRFRSFSAYIARLIENDLSEGGDLTLKEGPPQPNSPKVDAAVKAAVKYTLGKARKKKDSSS